MKTSELVERYLACRQATGIKYESGAKYLRRLARLVKDSGGLTKAKVGKAVLTDGRMTLTSRMRRSTFAVFFRWCVARGYLREMPILPELPRDLPRRRPHIFTDDEIRRLLSARRECQDRPRCMSSECARAIIMLTYALGLRISEALSLKLKDVDAAANVATIRETKFYKTRLVPYNRTVAGKLDEFMRWRRKAGMPVTPESPLFARRDGAPVGIGQARNAFHALCEEAGIAEDGGRPHVHDLRHSFAVRRLVSWYREGRDVQTLLPKLSVYMGHSSVAGTSVYLSMTPELLSESCARFERYVNGGLTMNERKESLVGHWIRRFMQEHLVTVRNCSHKTLQSYRDAYRRLLPYAAKKRGKGVDTLLVSDISPRTVLSFLDHLERDRHNSVRTRNQRLAAITSLARYISTQSPEHVEWFGSLKSIPSEKATNRLITYLGQDEMDAIMSAPDASTELGFRDHVILRFLYNTGARADEVAALKVRDVHFGAHRGSTSIVDITGKGRKQRQCPLMKATEDELRVIIGSRTADSPLFVNRQGKPMTRYGIYEMVVKYAEKAARKFPSLMDRRPSPHTIRHTTGTHLVQAGVDVNTVRAWLGHASLETTNIYVEVSMDAKVEAMEAALPIKGRKRSRHWRDDKKLMNFLNGI